jgi:superfamily II DNA or RNA helicase
MELRDYQIKAVSDIYAAWNSGAINVLIQLSTGGGKTVVLSKILSDCQEPSIVIAHRVEIVSQISLTLGRYGIRHNIIAQKGAIREIAALHLQELKKSYYDPQSKYVVAGVDTLLRMNPETSWFRQVKLIIQDEAHHVLQKNKWGSAAKLFPNARGLYPTATPVRADGYGLGRHADGVIDVMVHGPSMRELIKRGYLTEYRIISAPNDLDLSVVPLSAGGDYSPIKLSKAVHKSRITGDVVSHYTRFAAGKLGVTFAVDLSAAAEIASEFKKAGIPAEVICGKTPNLLRASILRRFRNREIMQIVNVDLLGEGFDCPGIEVVSMARPTQSFGLFCQSFGRALRPMTGKDRAIIIDHVGNVMRHGLPDDCRRTWSLDRRERRIRSAAIDVIPLKNCLNPECMGVYERFYRNCPNCGFYSPPATRSSPEQVDGDLLELDESILALLRGEVERIDDVVRIPQHLDVIAQKAVAKRHTERQQAQRQLRESISVWAGYFKNLQLEDSEIYRRFYFDFKIDIMSAQALNTKDAEKLKIAIDESVNLKYFSESSI